MSFDADFNYAPAVAVMNEQINLLQTVVANATAKITLLQSSPYADMVSTEIGVLELDNVQNLATMVNYQDIIDEITRVQTLSQPEKALLYYFYTTLGVSRPTYMIKMLFNTHIVNDPRVIAVYTDVVSSNAVKLLVAQMLYDQFPMSTKCLNAHIIGLFM